MREYKHAKLISGILFIGGLIFSFFIFGKIDFVPVMTLVLVFCLAGFLAGQEHVYDKYKRMHYTALENDAKKRREQDEKLNQKIKQDISEYEAEEIKFN